MKKAVAMGRHNSFVNRPDWGDSDIADGDGSMEISQVSEKIRRKSDSNLRSIQISVGAVEGLVEELSRECKKIGSLR